MALGAPSADDIVDIAIVGGGVAGAYAGYRLLRSNPSDHPVLADLCRRSGRNRLRTEIFEWSERIGGRLWSVKLPGLPDVPAEMGGMRFLESMQNIYGLCKKELGLDVVSFDFQDNIQFLRNRRFNFADYKDSSKVPYELAPDELGKSWMDHVSNAIAEFVPEYKEHEGEALMEYLRNAKISTGVFRDKPLHELGFWSLLANKLSIEAYNLLIDASGYYSIYGSCNAYIAILDYARNYADMNYYCLKAGYQALPITLGQHYENMGGKISLLAQVSRLDRETHNGEDLVKLTFGTPSKGAVEHRFARHVILALPQRGLQLLDQESFIFANADFVDDINSVTPQYSSKLFLTFDHAWWKDLDPPIVRGRSDTDLPLRQCYYFGTQPTGPTAGMALMMASYNDGRAQNFWDSFLPRSKYGTHKTSVPYINTLRPTEDDRLAAPPEMVSEIRRQLGVMHGLEIPQPKSAIFHNWVEDPSGGGWYFWNPYAKSWEIAPRVRRPLADANLYVCGSCFSENQGWVEGALNSTDMMLMTYFGLAKPSWVKPDYYLGP